jgi:hypothetical protein
MTTAESGHVPTIMARLERGWLTVLLSLVSPDGADPVLAGRLRSR